MSAAELVSFLAAASAGFLAAWFLLRSRAAQAGERARREARAGVEVLEERLGNAARRIEAMTAEAADAARELARLRAAETALTAEAAALREVAGRVPALEGVVGERDTRIEALMAANTALKETLAELQARGAEERRAAEEKIALLAQAREQLSDTFRALSADALKLNSASFLDLARTSLERHRSEAGMDLEKRQEAIRSLVDPLEKSLGTLDMKLREIENDRRKEYGGISEHLESLARDQGRLRSETENLVKALRQPTVRGRWGEIQLKRVTELAGMVEYCDFVQQESVPTTSSVMRPDMIIRLPNGREIVVDSKAPLDAYLRALDAANEDERIAHMRRHARQIADHIAKLSRKAYWDQLATTPEFVVLFLPGENFFSAALEFDPGLIETGVTEKVILATPTTLIALLKAVAYGWRQEALARNARDISELGRELHARLGVLAGHFADLRASIDRTVASYNNAVGSLEHRVLVTARRFKELGAVGAGDIPEIEPIDTKTRSLDDDA